MSPEQSRSGRKVRTVLDSRPTVQRFVAELAEIAPEILVDADVPDDPAGETWIDLSEGTFRISVSFRPELGFGVFVTVALYGEGPDEIFRTTTIAVRRIAWLFVGARAGHAPAPLTLADIRTLLGYTQTEIAAALQIRQPSVQRTEQRDNSQLDTLASYVAAMGGRLELRVVFDDMEAMLSFPARKGAV